MSYVVNAVGQRVPNHLRAAFRITLGCVILGGCSASSDRFSSTSFSSGYEAKTASTEWRASSATGSQQAAEAQAQPPRSFQVASASSGQSNGYLQVSRVDLPPLPDNAKGAEGTKTADGYGPYNRPPLTDGTYAGPRVYTPYDGPRDEPPPPPPPAYGPGAGDAPGPGAGAQPPSFYGRPEAGPPRFDPRPQTGIYEPRSDYRDGPSYGPSYREERREYPREYYPVPERGAYNNRPSEGKAIIVAPGDTLYSLARRYGVTVDMIARANGLSSPSVRPGTELIIPSAGPAAYAKAPSSDRKTEVAACAGDHCHTIKPGDTISSIARNYGITEQRILQANNLPNGLALKPGQAIIIPMDRQAPRQAIASAAPDKANNGRAGQSEKTPSFAAAVPSENGGKPNTLQDPQPLKPAPEAKTAAVQPAQEPSCEAALANPLPRMGNTFRRPVEGKMIAQFGPQRDGTINEGVTISVPRGTPIKAAENGVVAYVGDELPGFGNLILIRHADEYVTAYAHADTILVKKCDVVKRGQAIATAGATGDAGQPQLHFEIRKNSKPVDPGPLLGS